MDIEVINSTVDLGDETTEQAQGLSLYEYEHLETQSTIRVIELLPATELESPLCANIVHVDRTTFRYEPRIRDYQAVSYCWGEARSFSKSLICNENSTMPITPAVEEMLRYLRKTDKPRNLWVDAISLNQKDNNEKSVQVQLMGEIYHQADKVHVWLGTPDAEVDETIPQFFALLKDWVYSLQIPGLIVDRLAMGWKEQVFLQRLYDLRSTVHAVLSCVWFTRRWVLQEVGLAHDITVHFGQHKIGWIWFAGGIKSVMRLWDEDEPWVPRLRNHVHYAVINTVSVQAKLLNLGDLIWNSHRNDCSDPRDRLFSLYGLKSETANDEEGHGGPWPAVNYDENSVLVFAKFAYYLGAHLKCWGKHLSAFGSLYVSNPILPSWIPDWRQMRDPTVDFDTTTDDIDWVRMDSVTFSLTIEGLVLGPVKRLLNGRTASLSISVDLFDQVSQVLLGLLDPRTKKHPDALRHAEVGIQRRIYKLLGSSKDGHFILKDRSMFVIETQFLYRSPNPPPSITLGIHSDVKVGDSILCLNPLTIYENNFKDTGIGLILRPVKEYSAALPGIPVFRFAGYTMLTHFEHFENDKYRKRHRSRIMLI